MQEHSGQSPMAPLAWRTSVACTLGSAGCGSNPSQDALFSYSGCKNELAANTPPLSAPFCGTAGWTFSDVFWERPRQFGSWLCKSGNYTCVTIEHFAAFAPAFGRRPYIHEKNLSIVLRTGYSLTGLILTLALAPNLTLTLNLALTLTLTLT